MYEIKKRKGRLLTASSLALAVILTMGAGSAWAAANQTPSDGGTVTGGDDSTPITIQDAPGTTASVVIGSGGAETSVLGANADVETIAVSGGNTLTIHGSGGNLVENTETHSAINLAIGMNTTIEVTDLGGTIGDITGTGTGAKLAVNGGSLSAGTVKGVRGLFDPSANTLEDWIDGDMGVANKTLVYIAGHSNQAEARAFALEILGNIGVDTTAGWANSGSFGWSNAHIVTDAGLNKDVNSVLALSTPTIIGSAASSPIIGAPDRKYLVDGSITNNTDLNDTLDLQTDAAVFADKSLLVIDAARLNGQAALTVDDDYTPGNKTAVIDQGASLYIVNTQLDTTILAGFDDGISNGGMGDIGWKENVRSDSRLFNLVGNLDDTTTPGTIKVSNDAYIGAGAAFGDGKISSGTANMINGLYLNKANNVNSANAGIKFVSRAVNNNYLDNGQNSSKYIVTTLEGAQAMASTAGVQTSTYSVSNTLAENYNARLSYLRDTAPAAGSGEAGTIGIWINPFYNSSDVDGVKIGRHSTEYDFNYGGATIGLDSNINENFRLGLAFSVGGGETESQGHNFRKTESDFDFWGLGVYGSYTDGMFGLTGDISYSSNSYDIDQRIPAAMRMGNKLTADVDTDAFTVGLTGEYRFLTNNNLNIIPHLGLRYTNLKTDSYRVKAKGLGNVFSVSSETQNIWTIPLGVTFTGELATSNNWFIQPKADLGVIFATGDLDADSKFRINGTSYGGRITADDVVDSVTFNGLVGLKAENCDGFSVGLDYNFKASDNLTSHGVTGTIRYDF